jgi:hypothetical protein
MRVVMKTASCRILLGGMLLAFVVNLSAAGFNITIEARAANRKQTAASGKTAPAFAVKRGESLTVQWTATNAAPGPALSDVTMHAVLDKDGPGASATPAKPSPAALYEGAVNLDFRPGDRGSGSFRMPMVETGSYVLRVETIGIRAKAGAEAFAVMKVTVQ